MFIQENSRAHNCPTIWNLKPYNMYSDILGKSSRSITNYMLDHPCEAFDISPVVDIRCKTPTGEIPTAHCCYPFLQTGGQVPPQLYPCHPKILIPGLAVVLITTRATQKRVQKHFPLLFKTYSYSGYLYPYQNQKASQF